MDYQTLIKGRY